jgi:peptidoglycan/LPS O-acetylase OafA/YrhL
MREQIIDKSGKEAAAQGESGAVRSSNSKDMAAMRLGLLDDCRGIGVMFVFLAHCASVFPESLTRHFDRPWEFLGMAFAGKIDLQTAAAFLVFYPVHMFWVALPIFFVVSGFCIHLSYFQPKRPDLKGFYIRRFFRIYPPYLLPLLFFAFFFPPTHIPLNKLTYWGEFVTHLFMTHNVSELSICAINTSYWTLAVEVQLYALFPLVLVFVRRSSYLRVLIVLAIVEFTLRAIGNIFYEIPGSYVPALLRASPLYYCFSWVLGAALADAFLTGKRLPFAKVHPMVWFVIGLLTSPYPTTAYAYPFFALATVSYLSRRFDREAGEATEERLSPFRRYIRITGTYSYSIYLIHTPILIAVDHLFETLIPGLDKNPFLLFAIGASTWSFLFPLGALMYYWVEKPSINLGRKVLRSLSKRTEPPVVLANQGATS